MKKHLLAIALLFAAGLSAINAQQVLNNSFETWDIQTSYFDGFNGFFPADTFTFSDPVDWTTTNALTGADTLGHFFFVTESANAHTGSKALQVTTDTLKTVGTPLGPRSLTIPGLAINGRFPLDLGGALVAGGTLSPVQITGAGQPFTRRLATIKGFYNYSPVFNDSLGHVDSCIVWAVLRKGATEVGSAKFVSGANTGGYQAFSANFNYTNCEMPDTLVILVAASIPNFGSILTGTTNLVRGSVLQVDDLAYDTLAANVNFPPNAVNDIDTTTKNNARIVLIKNNDNDCNNGVATLPIAIVKVPNHGTAAVVGTTHILYTPDNNYIGVDSFLYSITDGTTTDTARVRMLIFNTTGIDDEAAVKVVMYPMPAGNELNIQFENNGKSILNVYDLVGQLVKTVVLNGNTNAINIQNLTNGVYAIRLTNDKNEVIARSKFTVSR
jgi:hypothetical protein